MNLYSQFMVSCLVYDSFVANHGLQLMRLLIYSLFHEHARAGGLMYMLEPFATLDQLEAFSCGGVSRTQNIDNMRKQCDRASQVSSWVEPLHESYAGHT